MSLFRVQRPKLGVCGFLHQIGPAWIVMEQNLADNWSAQGQLGGYMRAIIATLALTTILVSPAWANMCVLVRDIVSTHSDDGKLMTFHMRDGRVLVNHLQGICSDLRYEGFIWSVPSTEDICEYQQSLKVLHSGQICVLGKFDEVKQKAAAAH